MAGKPRRTSTSCSDPRGHPEAVYLQDRFCTSQSDDTQRLYYLGSHFNLEGTEAADWKLEVVASEVVRVGINR